MKAVALTRYLPIADPESLVDVTLPDPKPAGHDILVKVEAVSVNPVDTKQRAPSPKVEVVSRACSATTPRGRSPRSARR